MTQPGAARLPGASNGSVITGCGVRGGPGVREGRPCTDSPVLGVQGPVRSQKTLGYMLHCPPEALRI